MSRKVKREAVRVSQQLAPWVIQMTGAGVIGGIAGKSSTQTAAWRDLQRLICEREEIPWGEISFDMTKCFDSLPRASLVGVALRRGMPEAHTRVRRDSMVSKRIFPGGVGTGAPDLGIGAILIQVKSLSQVPEISRLPNIRAKKSQA